MAVAFDQCNPLNFNECIEWTEKKGIHMDSEMFKEFLRQGNKSQLKKSPYNS